MFEMILEFNILAKFQILTQRTISRVVNLCNLICDKAILQYGNFICFSTSSRHHEYRDSPYLVYCSSPMPYIVPRIWMFKECPPMN